MISPAHIPPQVLPVGTVVYAVWTVNKVLKYCKGVVRASAPGLVQVKYDDDGSFEVFTVPHSLLHEGPAPPPSKVPSGAKKDQGFEGESRSATTIKAARKAACTAADAKGWYHGQARPEAPPPNAGAVPAEAAPAVEAKKRKPASSVEHLSAGFELIAARCYSSGNVSTALEETAALPENAHSKVLVRELVLFPTRRESPRLTLLRPTLQSTHLKNATASTAPAAATAALPVPAAAATAPAPTSLAQPRFVAGPQLVLPPLPIESHKQPPPVTGSVVMRWLTPRQASPLAAVQDGALPATAPSATAPSLNGFEKLWD